MDFIYVTSIDFTDESKGTPVGALSLCTILKNNGYKVEIVDYDYLAKRQVIKLKNDLYENIEAMANYIIDKSPRIISFYTMCNHYPYTIKLAEKIKEGLPGVNVIFGGPQATLTAVDTLELFPFIDAIAIGEGECTILPIVKTLLDNKKLTDVKGIAYREDNSIKYNGDCDLIEDLDSLPEIDYSFFEPEYYESIMNIDVGRGCPFNCTFCSTSIFWKRKYRLKSTDRIISEIRRCKEEYGINIFSFNHDIFTFNKKRIIEFCSKLNDSNLNIEWGCSGRVDTLDEEIIETMAQSGCTRVYLGIETGSSKMQKIIRKNLEMERVYNVVKTLTKYNISVTTSFIYGFSEETEEDLAQTLNVIVNLLRIGVEKVQLHEFSVMSNTDEYYKLSDKLELNAGKYSSSVCDIKYREELLDMISSSKKLFCSFYCFKADTREKFSNLDLFVMMLAHFYSKFKITSNILLERFQNNILEIYSAYKYIIKDIKKDSHTEIYVQRRYNSSVSYKYFRAIIEDFIKHSSDKEILLKIFKAESDIFDFTNKCEDTEKVVSYDINIFKLMKGYDLNNAKVNEKIVIKLFRIGDKKVRVKRIA